MGGGGGGQIWHDRSAGMAAPMRTESVLTL